MSSWPPTHRYATAVFYFLLSAWWHLCHMGSFASRWEEASGVKSPRQIQPFVLKEPAIWGPPSPVCSFIPVLILTPSGLQGRQGSWPHTEQPPPTG